VFVWQVWRDGQKKRVFVYRFLATGTIEEKVGMMLLLGCQRGKECVLIASAYLKQHV
jgi:hypothetical protein